jgi:Putative peptidoglycan binding domain
MQIDRRRLLRAAFFAPLTAALPPVARAASGGRPEDGVDNPEAPDAGQQLIELVAPSKKAPTIDPLGPVGPSPDAHAPDYAHVPAPFDMTPFRVTPGVLATLARWNRFELTTAVVLVGIRGAALLEAPSDPAGAVLSERRVDHRRFNCVLGVWDRTRDRLSLFTGSTVPNHLFVREQFMWGAGQGIANQLPTGLYRHEVGTHGIDSRAPQPGAFRMESRIATRRALTALAYETASPLALTRPYDNIHASGRDTDLTDFSSAGCQTVRGWYDATSGEPLHDYARFREAAGLTWPHDPATDGRAFDYMLLTARELRLAAQNAWAGDTLRLRAGSNGVDVAALQLALADRGFVGEFDGRLGPATVAALAQYQAKARQRTDAIATDATLRALRI